MLESFTCATFQARLNEQFTLAVDDGPSHALELVDARESPVNPGFDGARVPFSIVFRDPAGVVLPQRTYRLEHAELGTFDLFMVPIAKTPDGVRYEAVFT